MAKKPDKNMGKGKSKSDLMSRPDFLKATGVAAAGVGAAAVGLGGVAQAAPPASLTGFDGKAPGLSPISVVKMDPYFTYAGSYAEDGTVEVEGWPELLQRYIMSGETDMGAWEKMVKHVDFLYKRIVDLCNDYFKEDPDSLERLMTARDEGKKVCLKPNWVTALEDTAPAFIFDIQAWKANPQGPAPCGRGAGWGGSTPAPFSAAFMYYLIEDLGFSPDQIIVAEGGDKNEFDWKLFEIIGFPIPETAVYEGRVIDANGTPVWYGGVGFYWARKYLEEKGYPTAMTGYQASLRVDFPGWWFLPNPAPTPMPYVSPSGATGIVLYNSNYLGQDNAERAAVIDVPGPDGNKKIQSSTPWPWEEGVDRDPQKHRVVYSVTVHEAFDDDSVGFILDLPKLKIHSMGNITLALKNPGIGCPAVWAEGTDQGGNVGWKYSNPPNFDGVRVPCEKFGIAHEVYYGPVDLNGVPELFPPPTTDPNYPWNNDPFGHYDVHKTGGLGGFIMDMDLALQYRFGSNILHVVDGVVAANFMHEATGSGALAIELRNEGLIALAADPVALDRLMLRYLYKRIPVADYGYPERAFYNLAFICEHDQTTGQLYMPPEGIGLDWTTTETMAQVPTGNPNNPFIDLPGCENRAPWAIEAGLGKDKYYVVGRGMDPYGKRNSWVGSINGHLVQKLRGKAIEEPPEEVFSINHYYHIFLSLAMFRTVEAYLDAYDALTSSIVDFPLIATPCFAYPGCSSNMDCLLKNDMNGDGVMQMDEMAADAFLHGMVSAYANVPRDIILRELPALLQQYPTDPDLAISISTWKAAFYSTSTIPRHSNPFWNDDGPGGLGHYYFGYGGFTAFPPLIAWQLAMGPGPVPEKPYVANIDPLFYKLTEILTGEGHVLIYGTYGTEVTHILHPDLGEIQLPASLPPGTYWPSPHFTGWLTRTSFIFGQNFLQIGGTEGSAYWAANQYGSAMGYDFKFYIPHSHYDPDLFTPSPGRPDVPPGMMDHVVPVLESPFAPPIPGVLPYDPGKFFKAEFYDAGNNLVETWPDDYKL